MKSSTIARNYAEALFAAGDARAGDAVERYGALMDALAALPPVVTGS